MSQLWDHRGQGVLRAGGLEDERHTDGHLGDHGGAQRRGWRQFGLGVRVRAESLHLRPTLCDPVDCSPPGSSVHGILQARILEQAARPSPGGYSQPRD